MYEIPETFAVVVHGQTAVVKFTAKSFKGPKGPRWTTTCVVSHPNGMFVGHAIRNPIDRHSTHIARRESLADAIRHLDTPTRTAFWEAIGAQQPAG